MRITLAMVERQVELANLRLVGQANPPYPATVGMVVLNRAYGGTQVNMNVNEHGGQRHLSSHGYGTSREAYIFLQGFNQALDTLKDN